MCAAMRIEHLERRCMLSVGGNLDSSFNARRFEVQFSNIDADVGLATFTADGSLLLASKSWGMVARFDPAGERDLSFGANGVVHTGIPAPTFIDQLSDGSIVVGGIVTRDAPGGGPNLGTLDSAADDGLFASVVIGGGTFDFDPYIVTPTISRFSATDGTKVPGFERAQGNEQLVDSPLIDHDRSHVKDVELQPDGKVLVLLNGRNFRFNADGTRDLGFGDASTHTAQTLIDQPIEMHVQSDGTISIVGDGGYNSGIAFSRQLPSGELDATFGHQGAVGQLIYPGPIQTVDAEIQQVEFLPDGRFLVLADRPVIPSDGSVLPSAILFRADGSLDTRFGDGGIVALPNITLDTLDHLPDGRILIGGADQRVRFVEGTNVRLIRLLANGSADPTFGEDGHRVVQFTGSPQAHRLKAVHVSGAGYTIYGESDTPETLAAPSQTFSAIERYTAGPSTPMTGTNEAPDLIGKISGRVPKRVVAGKTLNVSFEVTNQGSVPATGAIDLLLSLSHDQRVGFPLGMSAAMDDQLAGRLDDVSISLAPGASKTFKIRAVVPAAEWDGPLLLVGYVDAGSEMVESNEVNNHATGGLAVPMPMSAVYEMEISAPATIKADRTTWGTVRFRNVSGGPINSLTIYVKAWDASTGEYAPGHVAFADVGVKLRAGASKSFKVKLNEPVNLTEFYLEAYAKPSRASDEVLARVTGPLTRVV